MKNKVVVIEYAAGTDKGFDGFRPDTKPILKAIEEATSLETEIVFYIPNKKEQLFEYLVNNASCVISRINPGNLKQIDEYFQFLKNLANKQVIVHTHPDVMINLDFKDILFKLKDTVLGEKSTKFYQDFKEFKIDFPKVLNREKIRVLKTNYGSTGEGVYLISLNEDNTISSTEAVNNEKEHFSNLDEFLANFSLKFEEEEKDAVYFKNKKGFVSCKYLSRINEGEIRVLLVNDRPISVVHKKPQEGEFSATLFSGAQYKYEEPTLPKYKKVIDLTMQGLDEIKPYCKNEDFPLLWTMDYILDYDKQLNDIYVLSEINCSCVGITTQLEYARNIAKVFKTQAIDFKLDKDILLKKATY
ncbi:Cj0069 family protein [Malaciobacter mytili]|uniref:Cj0069 family protein n=1 Tax=Malaciobacter mytili TaxID=603050 RepID=UPI003A85A15C